MLRKIYPIFLLLIITTIAVLNFYAYKFHWYWEFWWFDIIMHTLGGLWVASSVLWLRYFRVSFAEISITPKKFSIFLLALFSVYIVGGGWELFEFSMDKFITFAIHNSMNTVSDLFFDGIGGIIAAFLFLSVYTMSKKNRIKN